MTAAPMRLTLVAAATVATGCWTAVSAESDDSQPPSFVFMMADVSSARHSQPCRHASPPRLVSLRACLCLTTTRCRCVQDMGWGDWSRTGSPASTPHLEAMSRADTAVWFHRAYSGNPVRLPAPAPAPVPAPDSAPAPAPAAGVHTEQTRTPDRMRQRLNHPADLQPDQSQRDDRPHPKPHLHLRSGAAHPLPRDPGARKKRIFCVLY